MVSVGWVMRTFSEHFTMEELNKDLHLSFWENMMDKLDADRASSNIMPQLSPKIAKKFIDGDAIEFPKLEVDWEKLREEYRAVNIAKNPQDAPWSLGEWAEEQFEPADDLLRQTKISFTVICLDNSGYEDELVVGFSYTALTWNDGLIDVKLDSGETISVFSDRFRLENESEL